MARLKRESEKRAKALRKEREARALEGRNARRAEKAEEEGGGGVSNVARLREEGERQDGNKGQEDVDSEDEDGDKEEEEEEEEEFDPEEGLLLVYVCTHVAVISKGKGVAGTYLVATDTSWKSREQLAISAVLLETFAAAIDRTQLRHKVLFLDVVHTEREHEGFKTRHLYPPRNLYDSAAVLCGAVVVGSCRIGQTSEVDLDVLRREAADFWAAVERRHNGGSKNKARGGVGDSGTDSATSSGRSSCCSSGSSSDCSSSDSEGSTSGDDDGDDHDSDDSTDQESGNESGKSSDGSSDGNGSKSSGTGGNRSAGSRTSSGNGGRRNQRNYRNGGGSSDEDVRNTFRGNMRDRRRHRLAKKTSGRGKRVPRSPDSLASGNNRGETSPKSGTARKRALASGGGSGMDKGQQYEEGGMRACAAVYDRANYEEIMSVFGRAVRDGLKGQCVENTKLSRVLVVHLYDFIRREFSPFAHPRLSVAREEAEAAGGGAGGGGGVVGGNSKREKVAAKKKAAAEKKAKKEADRAEAKRRARLGAKALAQEVRQAKEAAMLREVEEEKRQRTQQVPVIAGLSISAIARATACASPSPPPQPRTPFPIEITRTSVRLAWDDPPFPGEPPFLYELEAKGDLRGNSTWASVFPPRYPSISSQPVNISHRVPGLGLRYRVRACNHGGWGAASDPTEVVTTKAWLEDTGANSAARAMKSLARAGGARLVLARMRRYSASLLNQESGFHQLVAEFNKGLGIPRASLAQEVAVVVADAMEAFSQVRGIQDYGLLLLGWAARGKGEVGSGVLSVDLVERCLGLVATAEKLHSMDVAIKGHAIWARSNLLRRGEGRGDAGATVEYSVASSEDDMWAGASSLAEQDVGQR
ncbi:unnamed protein product [Ectocarpus sp. 12 AP-2014]